MAHPELLLLLLVLHTALRVLPSSHAAPNSNLFREYIGAEFNGVRFSDVPVDPGVEFHFILSFAIDYTTGSSPSPADGRFAVFWDADNLGPADVADVKRRHPNVRVALSLGGDSVGGGHAYFDPSSVDSWVSHAVASLRHIVEQYGLDGVDVDYEHFRADPDTFAECIGRTLTTLKREGVISFASIAPFDNSDVQSHYMALWRKYGHVIDYVNFQFYAYDAGITVAQFLSHYERQSTNYNGGKVLASFISDGSGGLSPDGGFFAACSTLRRQGRLPGIFVWSADDSMSSGFRYERQSQRLLAGRG